MAAPTPTTQLTCARPTSHFQQVLIPAHTPTDLQPGQLSLQPGLVSAQQRLPSAPAPSEASSQQQLIHQHLEMERPRGKNKPLSVPASPLHGVGTGKANRPPAEAVTGESEVPCADHTDINGRWRT